MKHHVEQVFELLGMACLILLLVGYWVVLP